MFSFLLSLLSSQSATTGLLAGLEHTDAQKEIMCLDFYCVVQMLILQHRDPCYNDQKRSFCYIFFSYFFDRYHYYSRSGHFWIENRFLPECYLILTAVHQFYESQLKIPEVLKPVRDYRDIEGWVGM